MKVKSLTVDYISSSADLEPIVLPMLGKCCSAELAPSLKPLITLCALDSLNIFYNEDVRIICIMKKITSKRYWRDIYMSILLYTP